MKLTEKQYQKIASLLPKQRGNVKIENRQLLAALIYRLERGCSWRSLPEIYGDWHAIYVRLNRWSQNGVLERVYTVLSTEGLQEHTIYSLDSTSVKVHPCAHGARKKR